MDGLTDVIARKILPLVSKSAPLLGSVLGTPLGGVALSLIANAFGVDHKNLDAINDILTNAPEADSILRKVQDEHQETLAKIASQDYATEVDDRKNARSNAVIYKDFLRHMAYLITAGFFGALMLLFSPISMNPDSRELLSMLVGMLVSKWQTIIDFFYGSSRKQGGSNGQR